MIDPSLRFNPYDIKSARAQLIDYLENDISTTKEAYMHITNGKKEQFASMVRNFTNEHGLELYIERDAQSSAHFEFQVRKDGYLPKTYIVDWGEVSSLSEAGATVFANMIVEFRLIPEIAAKKSLKNMAIDAGLTQLEHKMPWDVNLFAIQDVIFNNPATIIKWADGTKTVVKTQNGETYDPEKGLAMAIAKKALGNKGNYYNEIEKWLGKYEEPMIAYPYIPYLPKLPKFELELDLTALKNFSKLVLGEDIISDVNESIENTFTKDSLN